MPTPDTQRRRDRWPDDHPSLPWDPAESFERHYRLIRRLATVISRRSGCSDEHVEEFLSWATCRLVLDDFAVLRRFEGRSSFRSFITTVLTRLLADYRNSEWGRWRPSTEAMRSGRDVIRLERSVYRDRLPLGCAIDALAADDRTKARRLARVFGRLPRRWFPRAVPLQALPESTGWLADRSAPSFERQDEAERVRAALHRALDELSAEDRAIIQDRFWQGVSIADIARARGLDQKALYRRIEKIRSRLRLSLERQGLGRAAVLGALDPHD